MERTIKIYIKEHSWLAALAARKLQTPRVAMVIGHTVFLYGASRDEFLKTTSWRLHECRHVWQYEEWGMLRFLLLYVLDWMRKGYYNNRFEADARNFEAADWIEEHVEWV